MTQSKLTADADKLVAAVHEELKQADPTLAADPLALYQTVAYRNATRVLELIALNKRLQKRIREERRSATVNRRKLFKLRASMRVRHAADELTIPPMLKGLAPNARVCVHPAPHQSGPCIYFLFNGDELVYIGQTVTLGIRVGNHIEDGKGFNRVFYCPIDPENLDDAERLLIQKFCPRLNTTFVPKEILQSRGR